ncbi:hypothetical protein ERJ75_000896600 [Trypanosoma vivax]|nr:hypothetical protein ERJ75_000896600 [Trypanosoma vivax]
MQEPRFFAKDWFGDTWRLRSENTLRENCATAELMRGPNDWNDDCEADGQLTEWRGIVEQSTAETCKEAGSKKQVREEATTGRGRVGPGGTRALVCGAAQKRGGRVTDTSRKPGAELGSVERDATRHSSTEQEMFFKSAPATEGIK